MNLQGRDLKIQLSGDDVRLLHTELAQIGLEVPERLRAFFGEGTRDAVANFQNVHRLEPTCVVDAATASAVNRAVEAITCTVAGTAASPDRAGLGGLRIQIVDKNVGQDVLLAEKPVFRKHTRSERPGEGSYLHQHDYDSPETSPRLSLSKARGFWAG